MKASLQTKLLLMCAALILMTVTGITSTYYMFTKADKHQESRRRIQQTFDIVFESIGDMQDSSMNKVRAFLQSSAKIPRLGNLYHEGENVLEDPRLINAHITSISTKMINFSRQTDSAFLALYALDKRLLLLYQSSSSSGRQDVIGAYVRSGSGKDTFLSLEDPASPEMMKLWMGEIPIPDNPLPKGVSEFYDREIPDAMTSELFRKGRQLGLRIIAPVIFLERTVGVLVHEEIFTQSLVERFASLSHTEINFFAGAERNIGTFSPQTRLEPGMLEQLAVCETLTNDVAQDGSIAPVSFEDHRYYQGACALRNTQGTLGAVTVNLSQELERQAIRQIVVPMLIVAGVTLGTAIGVSLLFSRKAVKFIQQLLIYIDRFAAGDIPEQLEGTYSGEFHEIQQKLNHMGRQLKDIVMTAKTLSDRVAESSDVLNVKAENMSQGAAQQAASAEEASASMEQMATNIRQNAENAKRTEAIALQSSEHAEEGAKIITDTVAAMGQIVEDISIINEIAQQTRLLSLNATIEAARAKEHGKAFSVVAAEVRQLSEVTRKAAEGINDLASSSLDVSEKAGEMLSTLIPSIHKTAEFVREISAASAEQSTGAAQINQSIQQLDQVTQQNSLTSHEITTTAEELATQAQQLRHTIEFFHKGSTLS